MYVEVSEVVLEIAKKVEEAKKVPRQFVLELLILEREKMHLPERRGIIKDIYELLERDYWPEET
jgi:hypothetical protein